MKNENKLQNRINQSTIDFTFKNIKTIKNHNDRIKCLYLLSDGRLASCANDKTINTKGTSILVVDPVSIEKLYELINTN